MGKVAGLALLAVFAAGHAAAADKAPGAPHWVGSWASAQQIPEPRNSLPAADLTDATLRQVVHLSIGGNVLRVRFSNAFGTEPLHIVAARIARPTVDGGIDPGSDTALTFSGASDVTIPAGADYLSDPVAFQAAPLSDLAVSIYLDQPPARETGHPGSRQTSFIVHGDQVSAVALTNPETVEHWYQLSGVEVEAPADAAAVVTLGDSITDGHAAITNGDTRWPDQLARDLQANPATRDIAVLNAGIGGNRILADGLGPNALARFDRDVLAPSGVRYAIVFEGINDLGTLTRDAEVSEADHAALVHRITAALQQMIVRAHAHGIKIFGATITPDGGSTYYHPNARNEADREAVNAWIRAPGHFDAVIDFDAAMRDPARPTEMRPVYDSGDHLHPGPVGYKVMGDAVPLSLFTAPAPSKPVRHGKAGAKK